MYAVNVKPRARGLIQFLVDPPSCVQLSFAREHNTTVYKKVGQFLVETIYNSH